MNFQTLECIVSDYKYYKYRNCCTTTYLKTYLKHLQNCSKSNQTFLGLDASLSGVFSSSGFSSPVPSSALGSGVVALESAGGGGAKPPLSDGGAEI